MPRTRKLPADAPTPVVDAPAIPETVLSLEDALKAAQTVVLQGVVDRMKAAARTHSGDESTMTFPCVAKLATTVGYASVARMHNGKLRPDGSMGFIKGYVLTPEQVMQFHVILQDVLDAGPDVSLLTARAACVAKVIGWTAEQVGDLSHLASAGKRSAAKDATQAWCAFFAARVQDLALPVIPDTDTLEVVSA